MTLTENNEEDSSDDKDLVQLGIATTSTATTTAEKLKEAIDAEVFSSDPSTLEHFGFSNVKSIKEVINLLGLYQGLLIHLPNQPNTETVQGW